MNESDAIFRESEDMSMPPAGVFVFMPLALVSFISPLYSSPAHNVGLHCMQKNVNKNENIA